MTYTDIELFIFDLDGTLYEDTDHFDYYASLIKEKLPTPDQQAEYQKGYDKMKRGEHLVAFGKAYDAKRDAILTLDAMTLDVTEVHDWNGQAWPLEKVHDVYSEPLAFDFENMIAVGDGWWYPAVMGRHMGVPVEEIGDCYIKTKDYMVTDRFQLTKTPGLIDTLTQLKENKKLVLMTNSERDDVTRLLSELGLTGLFTEEITSAFKPARTVEHFERLFSEYEVKPHQVLTIGDNFINDVAPALKMGMKGVYITNTSAPVEHEALTIVPSLTAILQEFLK